MICGAAILYSWILGYIYGSSLPLLGSILNVVVLLILSYVILNISPQNRLIILISLLYAYIANYSDLLNPIIYYYEQSYIKQISENLRLDLKDFIYYHYSNPIFISSTIIGGGELSASIKESFKNLGIYHLLVVSGMHVSYICWFIISLLSIPLNFLYAFRIINASYCVHFRVSLPVLSCLLAFLFCLIINCPQPAQRATFLFLTKNICQMFVPQISKKSLLIYVFVIQSIFFPINFISKSNILSWGAFLILSYSNISNKTSLVQKILSLFFIQLKLSLLVTVVFGQFSPHGIILNLICVPVFGVIFCINLIAICMAFCGIDLLISISEFLSNHFLNVCLFLDNYTKNISLVF